MEEKPTAHRKPGTKGTDIATGPPDTQANRPRVPASVRVRSRWIEITQNHNRFNDSLLRHSLSSLSHAWRSKHVPRRSTCVPTTPYVTLARRPAPYVNKETIIPGERDLTSEGSWPTTKSKWLPMTAGDVDVCLHWQARAHRERAYVREAKRLAGSLALVRDGARWTMTMCLERNGLTFRAQDGTGWQVWSWRRADGQHFSLGLGW